MRMLRLTRGGDYSIIKHSFINENIHLFAHLGRRAMLTSVCGINWGDEGKGKIVDLLSEEYA